MLITSVSNEKIKKIKSLLQKKYREQSGLFIAEGVKPVTEAIKTEKPITLLCGTVTALQKLPETDLPVLEVSESVYKSVSDELNPEGVLAVIKMPSLCPQKQKGKCLLLDGLKDPGNVGTIIRTAAAAGYNDVYLLDTADPFNPKTVRASMSGIFFVNLHKVTKENFTDYLQNIIVTDMDGENIFDTQIGGDFCLVIGSESQGVSKEVELAATKKVRIPMRECSESLNAGVAAGIAMYVLGNKYE